MIASRKLFALMTVVFLGWLGWLGFAVLNKDKTRVLSRAQLAAATHLVVADIALDAEGYPDQAEVVTVLKGTELSGPLPILNITGATPPGVSPFPGPGLYLLPLVSDGKNFRIAGLPRSPGLEPQTAARPAIYVWDETAKAQLRGLGLLETN